MRLFLCINESSYKSPGLFVTARLLSICTIKAHLYLIHKADLQNRLQKDTKSVVRLTRIIKDVEHSPD